MGSCAVMLEEVNRCAVWGISVAKRRPIRHDGHVIATTRTTGFFLLNYNVRAKLN